MQTVDNSKIESRAINTLEAVIDEHATMQYNFRHGDKEMSWDGEITLFNSKTNFGKKTFDDHVPVQIKGHLDGDKKYIHKKRITYPVNLDDLRVFYNDRGVLYFQIFMTPDGRQKEIFYASLYPSRIKSYLDTAERKNNLESINIPFVKLEKKTDKLYIVAKQFSIESLTQGSGRGQIVPHMIRQKDLDKVTNFTVSVVGAKNEFDFLERISTGDVCFYETKKHAPFKIPIEWPEDVLFSIIHDVKQTIEVGDKVCYEQYRIETTSEGSIILVLSENLRMDLKRGVFHFKAQTTIEGLRKDAEFLLAATKNETLKIQGNPMPYKKASMPESLESELRYYVELSDTLREMEFEYNRPYKDMSASIKTELLTLIRMKRGQCNHILKSNVNAYNWKLENKYIPVIVIRNEEDEHNKIVSGLYSYQQAIFVANEKEEHFRIPLYSHVDAKVLADLFEYKYEYFYNQIDGADATPETAGTLNLSALKLISVYDLTHKEEFLKLAMHQLEKIEKWEGKSPYYILNRLQIKKRMGEFGTEERKQLETLVCKEASLKFGIAVLLQDAEQARKYFDKMSLEEQETIKDFPIWNLYEA